MRTDSRGVIVATSASPARTVGGLRQAAVASFFPPSPRGLLGDVRDLVDDGVDDAVALLLDLHDVHGADDLVVGVEGQRAPRRLDLGDGALEGVTHLAAIAHLALEEIESGADELGSDVAGLRVAARAQAGAGLGVAHA